MLANKRKLFLDHLRRLLGEKKYDVLFAELDNPKNKKYSVPKALIIRAYRLAGLPNKAVELAEKTYNSNDKNNSVLTVEYLRSLASQKEPRKALSIALDFSEKTEIADQSIDFIHIFLKILYSNGRITDILTYTSKYLKFEKTSPLLHAYRASAAFENNDLEIYDNSIDCFKLEDLPDGHFVLKRNLFRNSKNNFSPEERGSKSTILVPPKFAEQPSLEASHDAGNFGILLDYYSNLTDEELLKLKNFSTFTEAASKSRQLSVLKDRLRKFKNIKNLNPMHAHLLRDVAHVANDDPYLLELSTSILLESGDFENDMSSKYIFQFESTIEPKEMRQLLNELMEKQKYTIFPDKLKVYLLSKAGFFKNEVKQFPESEKICEFIDTIYDSIDIKNSWHQVLLERNLVNLIYSNISITTNPKVSLISPIYRPDDIPILRENLFRQSWTNLELIVIANGPLYNDRRVLDAFSGMENVKIVNACDLNVGAYLNIGIEASTGDIIMRFDSDDIYLSQYVTANILMLEHHKADVLGKKSNFVFLEGLNLLVRHQPEINYFQDWKFTNAFANGPTMVFRRSVFDRVKFNETISVGEDFLFAKNAFSLGYKCVNIDPFNSVVRRREDKGGHTWNASATFHLSNAMVIGKEDGIFSLGTSFSF